MSLLQWSFPHGDHVPSCDSDPQALTDFQKELLLKLLLLGVTNVMLFAALRMVLKHMDPSHEKKAASAVLV